MQVEASIELLKFPVHVPLACVEFCFAGGAGLQFSNLARNDTWQYEAALSITSRAEGLSNLLNMRNIPY